MSDLYDQACDQEARHVRAAMPKRPAQRVADVAWVLFLGYVVAAAVLYTDAWVNFY